MRRGDIRLVTLDLAKGGEQRGVRPVLVVAPDALNKNTTPIVCPIATAAVGQRLAGLTVSLSGAGTATTGVVPCARVRALDLATRGGRRLEAVPDFILDAALSCLQDIFEV